MIDQDSLRQLREGFANTRNQGSVLYYCTLAICQRLDQIIELLKQTK